MNTWNTQNIAARVASTWCLRMNTLNSQKTAAIQVILQEEENHNTWNALLEALTMPGSSQAIQKSLRDWEVCRVDILYVSTGVRKQESDCRDSQKHVMRACANLYQGVVSRRASATRPASLREMCDT